LPISWEILHPIEIKEFLGKKLSKKYNSISKMIRENSLMKPTRFLIQVYFAHHPTK